MAGATPEAKTAVEEDEVLATEDVVDDFVEATEAEELVAADDDDDDVVVVVVVVVVVGDRKVWWAPRGREKRPPQSSNSGVHFRTSYHADLRIIPPKTHTHTCTHQHHKKPFREQTASKPFHHPQACMWDTGTHRNNWNARSMSASLRDRTNASSSVVTGGCWGIRCFMRPSLMFSQRKKNWKENAVGRAHKGDLHIYAHLCCG